MSKHNLPTNIDFIFDPNTIRERCSLVFAAGEKKSLKHWNLDTSALSKVADYVVDVIKDEYPDLDVPYHGRWRHIDSGGVARIPQISASVEGEKLVQARALFEATILSVLVDAGAGMGWKYVEKETSQTFSKSEGLAVAAFHMHKDGLFSSKGTSFHVDAAGLRDLTSEKLQVGFQVTESNPIVGLNGRAHLLQSLGSLISKKSSGFPKGERLSELFDHISSYANGSELSAKDILKSVLQCLGPIWPGRSILEGFNLGDCWEHYAVMDQATLPGLLPFHKLSQWLSYSLFEVFEYAGYTITDMDSLTGLPEYRNGGLFTDFSVLTVSNPSLLQQSWRASDEFIVEWRALTVILLDKLAEKIRTKLGLSDKELPLAKILQGGTWTAGRRIAKEKRADGGPPFPLVSDGTVF